MNQCNVVVDRETLIQMRMAIDAALNAAGGPEVPLAFDEAYYLEANPDVRAAVEDKIFRTGYEHYVRHGKAEGRSPTRTAAPAPQPAQPMWEPAQSYVSKDDLLRAIKVADFRNAVVLDDVGVHQGFGPAIKYWTWPDGTVRRSKPPDAGSLLEAYGSIEDLLEHATSIGWRWAVVVDGVPRKGGFDADYGESQYETFANGVRRIRT